MVADGGVDGVGKVDGRSPGGQVLDVAVRRKYVDLVGEHIHLEGGEEVLSVGILLAFEKVSYPGEFLLVRLSRDALLILPVGGYSVFRRLVHLPRSYLHLEGYALSADDGGVQGLIHIGLRRSDIVLEAARDRLIHIVDAAEHVIALRDIVDYHAEGVDVHDLGELLVLPVHLAVDGIDILYPLLHDAVYVRLLHAVFYSRLGALHKALVFPAALGERVLYLLVADGVEVDEGQILEL